MNFYPFHIGDYAAHTRNLSLLEDLAYRRLIDAYYLAERPLNGSATDVARLIGMRDQVDDVDYVLKQFFVRDGDSWVQPRADKEIAKYQEKLAKASSAGKASAAKRLNKNPTPVDQNPTDVEENANGRSTNQEPRTKNQEPTKSTPNPQGGEQPKPAKADPLEGFTEFWLKYPKKKSKADAEKAWAKLKPDTELRSVMAQALINQMASRDWLKNGGEFIPLPATWLNGKRWLDEVVPAQASASRHNGFDGRDYETGLKAREGGGYVL